MKLRVRREFIKITHKPETKCIIIQAIPNKWFRTIQTVIIYDGDTEPRQINLVKYDENVIELDFPDRTERHELDQRFVSAYCHAEETMGLKRQDKPDIAGKPLNNAKPSR